MELGIYFEEFNITMKDIEERMDMPWEWKYMTENPTNFMRKIEGINGTE